GGARPAVGALPDGGGPRRADAPRARLAPVAIGLSDLPGEQDQRPCLVDLEAGGHLLIVGSARSGRSTVLRTFAGALAARVRVRDAHLFGLDCGNNALLALTALPHTGAVVGADSPDRVERLFGRLRAEVAARREALAERGYADLAEQRAAEPDAALPYLVLLLDRYEGFLSAFEGVDGGRLVDELSVLLREGPAAGLRVLVTTDGRGLTGRLAAVIEDRLVLRLADRADYVLAGLPGSAAREGLPPGRGFRTVDEAAGTGERRGAGAAVAVETQVALLDPEPSGRAQVAALARLGAAAAARDAVPPGPATGPRLDAWTPMRVDAPPARITLTEALALGQAAGMTLGPAAGMAPGTAARAPLVALVGVGGDELGPLTVDLAEDGPGFVVAGPPRSGRSTALLTMALTLLAGGTPLVLVTPRPSPLRGLAGTDGVLGPLDATASPAELTRLLAAAGRGGAGPAVTLMVDDAELLVDSPLAEPIGAFLRAARDARAALVAAATTEDLHTQFRGFLVEARRGRGGLLLWPAGPADGELFGRRLSRAAAGLAPPGRGQLYRRGTPTLLQVPHPAGVPPGGHTPA
ncbi:FtsK/SpoIIIE domain-containing protein, partial [Frankia nepalensis]|uniref:FtsK/SpoIIIE domain-containing protein n=1 Tax=Frankia nepalensis TaxID=1836974 RepID=UPI0020355C2F